MSRPCLRRAGLMGLLGALFLFRAGLIRAALRAHIGYGFNVADPGSPRLAAIGFDWIKTFNTALTSTSS